MNNVIQMNTTTDQEENTMTHIIDYLKPGTPAEVIERINRLEEMDRAEAVERRLAIIHAESKKDVSWLLQFDAFKESPFGERESPDYWSQAGYELANAAWDVRLCVAPNLTLETVQRLANGLAEWVNRIGPDEYSEMKGTPPNGARIEAPKEPRPASEGMEPPF